MNDLVPERSEMPLLTGQYVFLPVDRIIFGPGTVAQLSDEMERIGSSAAVLVTTGSLAREAAILSRVEAIMGDRRAATLSSVRQHAPASGVLEVVAAARRLDAGIIVSLGGGSVIDTVKAAILAIARDTGEFRPHVALPTTLSAAEFSPLFGVTDDVSKVKAGGNNPFVTPQSVILDVELTAATPDWLWLATGMRAVDHAVETVYAPEHQPATDAPALEAIRLLFEHLPRSTGARASVASRQQCQLASWLSFFGVANVTLGLSHILGREIGPRFDVPHGYTSAILLPHVMRYLLPRTRDRQSLIAAAAGRGGDSELASVAVSDLVAHLHLPHRLRDVHVREGDLESIAAGRPGIIDILQAAW